MKKSLATLLGLGAACALNAAIIKNPDPDTLWLEDGNNVKFSKKAYSGDWHDEECKFTPDQGGILMEPRTGDKAYGGICVPTDRDYPWMEFDLEIVEKKKGFYFHVTAVNAGPWYFIGQDGSRDGHYFLNVFENTKGMPEKKGGVYFGFRVYNGKVRIKNLRMTKKPFVQLNVKSAWFDTRKFFSYEACLEFTMPDEKKAKGPVRLRFAESGNGNDIELNNEPYLKLKNMPGYPGKLAAGPDVNAFSIVKQSAGKVLVEIEGFGRPVFTWLAYEWDPGRVRDSAQTLPANYAWISDLRTDHPRIFINKDTLPKVQAWAKKIGYKQLLADADNFELDPKLIRKRRGAVGDKYPYATRDVTVPATYEEEAQVCALAYLLTGDKKYVDKTWIFLDHNLAAYKACRDNRTAISWYGIGRIENMAALDWVWNASDPERCKKYLKEFIDVNILYVRYSNYGPFYGVNSGGGKTSGFYGDSNNELVMGILAYKAGVDDALAVDLLKKGYDKYRACLNFRDGVAEDDGILSTTTMGYCGGQYPWVSYDFLYLWRAAFQNPVKLPKLTHLLYFAEWYQWNMIPGKGNESIREFGLGDNEKSTMRMDNCSGHLYQVLGAYGQTFPEDAKQIASAIARINGKFDPDHFKEYPKIYKRKKAPLYHWGFYRAYLAYGLEGIQPAGDSGENKQKAMARHFPVGGIIMMHSGSAKDSAYALFKTGNTLSAHVARGDENHFTIFRKGYLAIDSGYRYDTWYGPIKYHQSSVAHNTMLIHDPSEKFPADEAQARANMKRFHYCWDPKEAQELFRQQEPYLADAQGSQDKIFGGKCRAFSTNAFYSYAAGDASKVYSSAKCKEFNRQFLHIQPNVFVVFDRVESVKPEFRKEWLLHFMEEPVVTGNQTLARVTDEGGILRCTSLLPKNGVITKIGGPGKEFYGANVNWNPPQKLMKTLKYGGKWRINLSPATPSKRDYFLNVIDVGDNAVSDIQCTETDSEATVSFVSPEKRKVAISFSKTGRVSGRIRIEENGKVLCEENLSERIQHQKGFLF